MPLAVRTRPPHPSSDGGQSRPLAARQRLAQRGGVRVLSAAPRSRASPRRRRHLAEVDDQHLAGARRAARLAGVPEGARVLLRQRATRLRGEPRALHARRAATTSSRSRTSGRSSTSGCGSCTGASAATFRARSPSCSAAGHIEIITCAATHGYLPLLSRDESIHLQLRTAVETHRRHFGRRAARHLAARVRVPAALRVDAAGGAAPRASGDCAPASRSCSRSTTSSTSSPTRTSSRRRRPSSSIATTSRARRSSTRSMPDASRNAPLSPYQPYRVASRGGTGTAVAFFRDPKTTLQVWSREHGYPGEYAVPRVPQEALPRRPPLLAHHGLLAATSARRPCTIRRSPPTRYARHARHFVELVGDTLAARERAAGRRSCARRTTPSCSDTGGSKARSGSSRSRARWRAAGVARATLGEALEAVAARRGRSRSLKARGARAATIASGSTGRPSGRGTASTAPRPNGSSTSRHARRQRPRRSARACSRKRRASCSCSRPPTGSSSSRRRPRATTPSGAWPSTTRSSSGCRRWRARSTDGNPLSPRGGRHAAPARARGLRLPAARSRVGDAGRRHERRWPDARASSR